MKMDFAVGKGEIGESLIPPFRVVLCDVVADSSLFSVRPAKLLFRIGRL